ncbi:MAG: hypothetical protein KF696_02825 [Planctomycetes bacterium]|nr:hypothetical protein [Planctomycetota bacterium]MCW8134938.1 hypothetical protein [Planctomycetota bacterium]
MYGIWINQIRHALGKAPRSHINLHDPYLTPPIPAWAQLMPNEQLLEQYSQHSFLFMEGDVGWAALVQANDRLFKPSGGANAMPALVVFSPQQYFDEVPNELDDVATELFELREQRLCPPELAPFKLELRNERGRYGRRAVPATMCGGREVHLVDVVVHREHLPQGKLTGGFFPVLHHPGTWCVWIVPSRFWPLALIDPWTEQ